MNVAWALFWGGAKRTAEIFPRGSLKYQFVYLQIRILVTDYDNYGGDLPLPEASQGAKVRLLAGTTVQLTFVVFKIIWLGST